MVFWLRNWEQLSQWFCLRVSQDFAWSCNHLKVWLGLASKLIHMTIILKASIPFFVGLYKGS